MTLQIVDKKITGQQHHHPQRRRRRRRPRTNHGWMMTTTTMPATATVLLFAVPSLGLCALYAACQTIWKWGDVISVLRLHPSNLTVFEAAAASSSSSSDVDVPSPSTSESDVLYQRHSHSHHHHHRGKEEAKITTTTTTTTTTNLVTNSTMPHLPTILLIGVQKGGSTALSKWLFDQGGVSRPQTFPGEPHWYNKEVHYFDIDTRYKQGLEFYQHRFHNHNMSFSSSSSLASSNNNMNNNNNNNISSGGDDDDHVHRYHHSMDATPATLRYGDRVKDTYDSANHTQSVKIMVVLRDPIARELSLYNHLSAKCRSMKAITMCQRQWLSPILNANKQSIRSFDEFVHHVTIPSIKEGGMGRRGFGSSKNGRYAFYLSKWFQLFDRRHQILVLSFHELQTDPIRLQTRVSEFLGIDTSGGTIEITNDKPNPFKLRLEDVSNETMMTLRRVFDPLNDKLYQLLEDNPGPNMEQRPFPRFS